VLLLCCVIERPRDREREMFDMVMRMYFLFHWTSYLARPGRTKHPQRWGLLALKTTCSSVPTSAQPRLILTMGVRGQLIVRGQDERRAGGHRVGVALRGVQGAAAVPVVLGEGESRGVVKRQGRHRGAGGQVRHLGVALGGEGVTPARSPPAPLGWRGGGGDVGGGSVPRGGLGGGLGAGARRQGGVTVGGGDGGRRGGGGEFGGCFFI